MLYVDTAMPKAPVEPAGDSAPKPAAAPDAEGGVAAPPVEERDPIFEASLQRSMEIWEGLIPEPEFSLLRDYVRAIMQRHRVTSPLLDRLRAHMPPVTGKSGVERKPTTDELTSAAGQLIAKGMRGGSA